MTTLRKRRIGAPRPPLAVRLLVASSLGLWAVLVPTSAEAVDDGGAKQVILALNKADGMKLVRSGVQVTSTGSNTAAPENLALANASCSDCRTVAVAVQAVLITRPSDVITPRNAAIAVNSDCQGCLTLASAYQCVVTTTRAVAIGSEGRQEIAQLRTHIAAVAGSDAEFAEIDQQLDALVTQLWGVIDAALAAADEPNRCNRDERQTVG